jgi:hypothetical protein
LFRITKKQDNKQDNSNNNNNKKKKGNNYEKGDFIRSGNDVNDNRFGKDKQPNSCQGRKKL